MSFLLNPYRFAAASTDVVIAVQEFATGTGTTAQNFTTAAFGGDTPVAVHLIAPYFNVSAGSGNTAIAGMAMGAVVGSGDRCVYAYSDDAIATTRDGRGNRSTSCVRLVSNNTVIKNATGTLIADGVELTYSTNGGSSHQHTFVGFAGTDTQASLTLTSLGTGTSPISVTGLGFEPDVVIVMSSMGGLDDTATTFLSLSYGIALNDGTQRCVAWIEQSGQADGKPFQSILTDAAAAQIDAAGAGLTYKVVVGGFNSDGFTLTPSANAGSDVVYCLALKFTGRNVALKDYTTPTSTGASSITGVGFEPQFALAVMTALEATDDFPAATSANQGGMAICLIGNEQWSSSCSIESAAATTNTNTTCQNYALLVPSHTDPQAGKATLTSFDSDGATFNHTAVQATGKKGFFLFVE